MAINNWKFNCVSLLKRVFLENHLQVVRKRNKRHNYKKLEFSWIIFHWISKKWISIMVEMPETWQQTHRKWSNRCFNWTETMLFCLNHLMQILLHFTNCQQTYYNAKTTWIFRTNTMSKTIFLKHLFDKKSMKTNFKWQKSSASKYK